MSEPEGDPAAPRVRRYREGDSPAAIRLLYESSGGLYDRYTGSRSRAEKTLARALKRPRTTASADVVSVAELGGQIAGAMAAMPYVEWTPRAHAFLRVTLRSVPIWVWPRALWLYRASGRLGPDPPSDCYYVDSLATEAALRRRGVATALLDEAGREARTAGLRFLALDTWANNRAARALYLGYGFVEIAHSPAVSGLPGGVALLKELG